MIASSNRVKLLAVSGAVLTHAAIGLAFPPDPVPEIAGGAGAPEARLGTSFADMAAGMLTAEQAQDTAAPVSAPAPEVAHAPRAATASPTRPEAVQPLRAEPAPAAEPLAALPAAPSPEAPEAQKPLAFAPQAVSRSLRPVRRSADFEEENKPQAAKPTQAAAPPPKPRAQPAPRGNSDTNAAAGTPQGSRAATAQAQGRASGQSTAAGTAAASNYPGLVMRKISGVRKPRMSQSGSARVSFSVASSGALAGVSIARSSGRAALDREALRFIQRAAPFPPPPASAQRSFAIDIEFR
ncbi:energy transducer TonB family protein [Roseovarius nanhaiticus]|uniref:energy transducer TonB family protein n=1 Tax=Roseovarius nanhaiticus TaxID=573024 RepID=UPI0024928234|nr:energy transducer TonB [Roseovarius nanhaiticus]